MVSKLPCYVHPEYENVDSGPPMTWYWVREEDHFPICRCSDRLKALRIRDLVNSGGL